MSTIGLITAVPLEAGPLLKEIRLKGVVHMNSGIGIANASHAATVMIEKASPRLIVLFGIGGAYPRSGLKVGDVVAAGKEIYADAGVLMRDGLHGMEETDMPFLKKGRRKYFNEFQLDGALVREALKAMKSIGEPAHSGVFLTVCQCTGTARRAHELERRFGAVCENMEGAAVAQICALYGVPMIEIRGISNIVEDRDLSKWDKALAAHNCQRAVKALISEI